MIVGRIPSRLVEIFRVRFSIESETVPDDRPRVGRLHVQKGEEAAT